MRQPDFFRSSLNTLFPITCVACRCAGAWLCPACWQELALPRPFSCLGCGQEDPLGRICSRCHPEWRSLNGAWIVGTYAHRSLRQAIAVLKFEEVRALARPLAALLYRTLLRPTVNDYLVRQRDRLVVVPTPMDRSRRRRRGFNQAELLADVVATLINCPRQDALRKRPVDPQVGLMPEERLTNLRDAISLAEPLAIYQKTVILVDDVVTTGATALECADVLRAAGARAVWVLALARG